jgi:hypothetical protein
LGKLIIKKEYFKIMGLASSFKMQQIFKRMNELVACSMMKQSVG